MDRNVDRAAVANEGVRILVIEDDAMVRFNIVSYLEDSGFTVLEEEDGAGGLARVRGNRPDLVLCDLRMPGMDGLEVLRTLRSEIPSLPLVVVSGTGVLGDVVDALRNGAWDFVTKPIIDMAMLEHAIGRALEKARLIRENRRYQMKLEQANRLLRNHLERFEQDAVAGRTTQLQLMPPPARSIGAYRFSRHLLPSLYLSGDFVDYFVIDPRYIGFFLADASGHGAASAFVTVLLKSFVERYRQMLLNDGDPCILHPAHTLTRLNCDLRNQRLDKYLTIFYGVIDSKTGCLSYSNGGHFPNPVLFDGHTSRFLESRGPPVGLCPRPSFVDAQLELPHAHALALFSDGVLDALPETRLSDKKARLLKVVDRYGLSAPDLFASLGLGAEVTYPDDITLLIAEREA